MRYSRIIRTMKGPSLPGVLLRSIIALSIMGVPLAALAEEKAATRLEAEYDRESNPKNRMKVAAELMELRLHEVRASYQSEGMDREKVMEKYFSAMERLEKAIKSKFTGSAPKQAEIRLRAQARTLESLKMNLATGERISVEKALDRVTKLHEELLYSIMSPRSR